MILKLALILVALSPPKTTAYTAPDYTPYNLTNPVHIAQAPKPFDWGQAVALKAKLLLDINKSDALDPFIREKFNFYVATSIIGLPNTSTFNYETRAFDRDLFKEIELFIKDNPDSSAAKAIGGIIEMIRKNAFILDQNILEYVFTQFGS